MIPGRSCQDGCWADPRGEVGDWGVKHREQEAEKGKSALTICNKMDS